MDYQEKKLSLRLVNKLIYSFKRINNCLKKQGSLNHQCTLLLAPNWLLNIKDELKHGNVIKLPAIVSKIRNKLEDCLRGLTPYLSLFCEVIFIEQILNDEILILPRAFKDECSKGKYKVTRKTKGADRNIFLHSPILKNVFQEMEESKIDNSKEPKSGAVNTGNQQNEFKMAKEKLQRPSKDAVSENHCRNEGTVHKRKDPERIKQERKESAAGKERLKIKTKISSFLNIRSRTLRDKDNLLKVNKKEDKRRDSKNQAETDIRFCPDAATAVMNPIVNENVPGSVQLSKTKVNVNGLADPTFISNAQKRQEYLGSAHSKNSMRKLQGDLNQTDSSLEKLIKRNHADGCDDDAQRLIDQDANKLGSDIGHLTIQRIPQQEKQSAEEKNIHQPKMIRSICPDIVAKKRSFPFKEDSAPVEKDYENSNSPKKVKCNELAIDIINGHTSVSHAEKPKSPENVKEMENVTADIDNNESRAKGKLDTKEDLVNCNSEVTTVKEWKTVNSEIEVKHINKPNEEFTNGNKYAKTNLMCAANKNSEEIDVIPRNNHYGIHMHESWKLASITSGDKYEELKHMAEIPEVSCFLHACKRALNLPFFTHFEFEWAVTIPEASHLMAAIMTALVNGSPATKKEQRYAPLPYLQWNRKLAARISHWFIIQKRIHSYSKVYDLIGVEPNFWELIGTQLNPLCLRPFHQLTICQRVIILKALCDHLFHVSKRIQIALISTPNNGREAVFLGRDIRGKQLIFFPALFRGGRGDIRIYEIEEYSVHEKQKIIKEEVMPVKKVSCGEAKTFHLNHPVECICKDERFCLVANDIQSLNKLVEKICAYYSEEEIAEAGRKLSEIKSKEEEEMSYDQQSLDKKEEECSISSPESDEADIFSSHEHLKLALKISILANNLRNYQHILSKSRSAAQIKLSTEWSKYNDNRLHILVIGDKEQQTNNSRSHSANNEKNARNEISRVEDTGDGQKNITSRAHLSRKVKCDKANLIAEKATQLSRKETVAKMEEDALMGKSNVLEEEEKWDPNLWADEESEDEESSVDEDVEWKGYETIKNWTLASNSSKKSGNEKKLKETEDTNEQMRPLKAPKTYSKLLSVKSVQSNGQKMIPPANEYTDQLKKNVQISDIEYYSTYQIRKHIDEKFLKYMERFTTNLKHTIQNQEESFGKLSLTPVECVEGSQDHSAHNIPMAKIGSGKPTRKLSKHIPKSLYTHEQLSSDPTPGSAPENAQVAAEPKELTNGTLPLAVREKEDKIPIPSDSEVSHTLVDGKEIVQSKSVKNACSIELDKAGFGNLDYQEDFCQLIAAVTQKNVEKEFCMSPCIQKSTSNAETVLETLSFNHTKENMSVQTLVQEEVTRKADGFKPFPLKSIILKDKEKKNSTDKTEEICVE